MKIFKHSKAIGFFDEDFRLSKLTELGDPLQLLSKGINFELFRPLMEYIAVRCIGKTGQ